MSVFKQASSHLFFIMITTTLLFSCSKENTPGNSVEQVISPAISLNASDRTSTVAQFLLTKQFSFPVPMAQRENMFMLQAEPIWCTQFHGQIMVLPSVIIATLII
jgi:hypothetical protein